MTSPRLYFDHNASAPLRPEAHDAMLAALQLPGNASSVHGEGRAARRLIEDAREQVAALVGCTSAEVVFTSGATEANCAALANGWATIYCAGIEHDSVLAPARQSGAARIDLPVDANGLVDWSPLNAADRPDGKALLSLQMANNETGVCQDVAGAAAAARAHGITVHTDAVQACGRMAVDFTALGVDLMSVSSHKLGGPMGVGALIVRDGFQQAALITGGGQERRRRAGTENVAAIAGFGAAASAAAASLEREAQRLGPMRDRLQAALAALATDAVIVGADAPRLANTLCIALPGERAETTVIKFDLAGIAVSAGAACSSGKVGESHVLGAMGLPAATARSAIRISLGWNTTETSLEQFLTRVERLLAPPKRAVA